MLHLLLLTALIDCSWSKTLTYDWHIGWILAAPDGFVRPVISVNGQWPPPTIEANINDTIVVNAYNELGNETTSLHFHGMFQNGTTAADGAVGIAQCGITPGGFFQYRFKANPAGTHWWHSHETAQYPDGLRGKMVIHDPEWEASLEIDEQIHLSISDWWHRESPWIVHDYLSVNNINGSLPTPDSFLVDDSRQPPELLLERDKRYLIRIVSMAGLVCAQFHIANHTLTVVAIDGSPVHPAVTDTIAICAGQSYDVLIFGDQYEFGANYILKMTTDMLTGALPSNETRSLIGNIALESSNKILVDDSETEPSQEDESDSKDDPLEPTQAGERDWEDRPLDPSHLNFNWTAAKELDDATLLSLDNEPLYENVDRRIDLRIDQVHYEDIGTRTGIGIQPWVKPRVPSALSAFTTGELALLNTTYGPGVSPYVVQHNEVVEIYMENPQKWPHPMHLHGHFFQIAGRGLGKWDGDEDSLYKVPAKRNNLVIPPYGWFLIRFRADNPGVWFMHCHIDLHLIGGMAATIIEAPEVLQLEQKIPTQNIEACEADYKCSSGMCNCKTDLMSEEESNEQCNTIFNTFGAAFGALITF